MKRIVLMCLFLSIITFVHAQVSTEKDPVSITGGVKVESSFSNFIHSGISKGSSKMNPGATVGGFLNLGISQYFSVQGELLFHYKESDFEWSGEKGNYQYWGAEIPVYAMYHWNRRDGSRLYVGIGPYTNFGFKATYRSNGQKLDLYEKDASSGLPAFKDSDTGFGITGGYEFPCGLQINASYKISVSDLLDANGSSSSLYPQLFSIGLGWRFGK